MKIMKYKLIFTLALFTLLTGGCKTIAKLTDGAPSEQKETAALIEKAVLAAPQFQTIDIKRMTLSVNMSPASRYSSPANCKMIRDSVIHISVQPFLGIEMFIARFTKQDIIVVDKTKNIYYQMNYRELKERFDLAIDFNMIQALLTNQLFVFGEPSWRPSMLRQKTTSAGKYHLVYDHRDFSQNIYLNDEFRVNNVEIKGKDQYIEFNTQYNNFRTVERWVYPHQLNILLRESRQTATFDMNISRIGINEPTLVPALNLNNYRRASLDGLLKQFD